MRKENIRLPVVLGGTALYLAVFFAARLPSLEGLAGGVFRRGMFFLFLFQPQILLDGWFGAPGEAGIVDRLPLLALAAVIVAASAAAGRLLIGWIGIREEARGRTLRNQEGCLSAGGLTRLEVFVFATAVGLNVASTYVLMVGLIGGLGSVLALAVPAALVLALACRFLWRRTAAAVPEKDPSSSKQKDRKAARPPLRGGAGLSPSWGWLDSRWLWLAAPFVIVILLGSMLPPLDFDVREYHLQVPKEFYQEGRIGFLAHNVYGNMAMGTEMLSLLGMAAAGDWWLGALVGKTVIGLFAPLAALGLLAAGRRFFSPTAGIIAAIVYLSTPWIARVSTSGLVEGASACYLLLAVYAVILWQQREGSGFRVQGSGSTEDRDSKVAEPAAQSSPSSAPNSQLRTPSSRPFLVLAGYLAGSAVSTKYPAALFVFLPLAVWVALASWLGGWRAIVGRLAVFALAAAVACGLWFGKNWVLADNPTYPLLYGVFDSPHWSAEKNENWSRAHRPHDFSPRALWSDAVRVAVTSEWLSPLLMPLALLGLWSMFFGPEADGHERWLAIAMAVYLVFVLGSWWLLTHRIDRFWIPLLPLVALLAGRGACWSASRPWRWTLIGLLVLSSLFGFLVIASGAGSYNRYFVSLARLRVSPERVGSWHTWLNSRAADGRVLLVGDAEPFDLEMPVIYNTVFDDSVFEEIASGRSAEEIRRELFSGGVTHVFVDWAEIARYRSAGNYGFPDFIQPEVFDELVAEGVLRPRQPPPELEDHSGRVYEVVGAMRP